MSVQHQGVGAGEDVLPTMWSVKLKIKYLIRQLFLVIRGELSK